jgi:hypothetical protein
VSWRGSWVAGACGWSKARCVHGQVRMSPLQHYGGLPYRDSMCRLGAAVVLRSACTPAAVTLLQ